MSYQNQIILQTKLHRPRLPNDLVTRTRLINLLNQDRSRQLILVYAPAGFGKTTLVSNWLRHMAADQTTPAAALPAAWLSLDENDRDLNLFLRYFIAALRTIFSDACEGTLALLQARQQTPETVLFATLSNELENLPGEAILVLDDYHTIQGMEVHNLLNELARHWPKPLHLVLISRTSPPLPLGNLRARGMISEIRTRDLRFTPEETATYLDQEQLDVPGQCALPLLEERFEGWPAGLHLAALSLRSAGSKEAVLAALSSENANITEYLVDEVLNRQFPAIHSFLLKTSFLDRFCVSLCEAVVAQSDPVWNARVCLDWIERADLFLVSLDNRREWYRYHHLFQELLQHRASADLRPDHIADLHYLASTWFETHGLFGEALEYALAAGNLELAARLMSAGAREIVNREDRPTLERWLRLLPEEVIQRHPELLMLRVWTLQFLWRLDLQAQVLRQVEALLDSNDAAALQTNDPEILRGQILLPKAQQAYFNNQDTQAINLCRQVLALLPAPWTFVRGGAMLYIGLSMQASGQAEAAERLLLAEYESCSDKISTYALFLLQSLGFIHINTGRLEQARQIAQVLVQGATKGRLALMKNWGDYYLGVVAYQRNELNIAAQYFTQIYENRFTAHLTTYRDAVAGLALIHLAQGEGDDAWQMVESISQFDLEQRGGEDPRTGSLRARLRFLQGNLEGAIRWTETFTDPPPDVPLLWLEEPQVTRVRILVARGKETDLQSAMQILDVLDEIIERTHNTRYKIEILALRALALDAQGETNAAESSLKQAVDLARPRGFIRVFVDLGNPMQEMLGRLAGKGFSKEAIHRFLEAFPASDGNILNDVNPARPPAPAISTLVEPLTPREQEILNLLHGPGSIKEIALQLHISYATAKRHTVNIYAKLGVKQRWSAVARAEELHIL